MKTSTIIRLSLFFFVAAFFTALVLKKITIDSTQENPKQVNEMAAVDTKTADTAASSLTNNQVSITEPDLSIPEPVDNQSTSDAETDASETETEIISLPAVKDNFSPKLANSWQDSLSEEYSAKVSEALSKLTLSEEEKFELEELIIKESELANLNPLLSFILIKLTSGFQKDLVRDQKFGLLQLSDEEAESIANQKKLKYLGKVTLVHPKVNTRLGLAKFRMILEKNDYNLRESLLKFSGTEHQDEYIQQVIKEIKTSF